MRYRIGAAVATFFIVLVLCAVADRAYGQEEQTVASVALSSRIPAQGRTTPDTVHQVSTTAVPAAAQGGTCEVEVTGANNESVHPNSDIVVTSANTVIVHDVEREAGASNLPADGELVLGESVTVAVRLGEDGLFSGGTLVVDFACTSPPPPTTTTSLAPPTTTTAPPAVTTVPPKACVDNPATATNDCELPHTGNGWVLAFVGIILFIIGLGILVGKGIKRLGEHDERV